MSVSTVVTDLDRLEKKARDLWGESWTIKITRWADGSQQAIAFRSRGLVNPEDDDELYERERLWIDQEQEAFCVRREHYRQSEVVEVVDEKIGDLES